MIRRCKQGKIDMIIVKSIARFARNTVDCLKFVRMLNDLNVVVYFEEQGIYSNQPGAEFYITIYGSIAQSESENISANVKWGKARSAKEGNVPFHYKNFLGYRKGADGKPEIDPEEAETIRFVYERFLAGDSLSGIAQMRLLRKMRQGLQNGCGRDKNAQPYRVHPLRDVHPRLSHQRRQLPLRLWRRQKRVCRTCR